MACKHKNRVWENGWCNVAFRYCTYTQEASCEHNKQTNADRIRNMTDEELAKWIAKFTLSCVQESTDEEVTLEADFELMLAEWLSREVDNES